MIKHQKSSLFTEIALLILEISYDTKDDRQSAFTKCLISDKGMKFIQIFVF